ncbi:MAG TPA: PSD1 and planctomycete cytochrome C domain-containing protein [Armatimonadota bacterium]|nr:PSD1 and planctomycete cytochrome C domain-containing protein [Armatimonadota bacterium]
MVRKRQLFFSLFPAAVLAVTLCTAGLPAIAAPVKPTPKIDFARQVQPLLKAQCFQCHGAGQKSGGLSMDSRTAFLKGGASGAPLTPGNSGRSLLVARILGHGGKPRMPLGFAPLSPEQISLLRSWIDEGAPWPAGAAVKKHWAYIKPVRPRIPTVKDRAWVRNPIDAFVLSRLEREGLRPSPEADPVILLRRVTLDLTGLPPTPKEIDAYLADHSPNAYDKVVTRLLNSPHYGERMALPWLDAARYADSNGFQQDGDTYQYVWRDWVIRALNANMPFDQFTIKQLAGDLLPHATLQDKIATGFNRCAMLNGEGGAIPEEARSVILFDRVDVTATTFLGITLACAQCHDHKYDPFTQRDYYSFLAFFNQVPETGVPPGGGQYRIAEPAIPAGNEAQMATLRQFEAEIAAAKARASYYEQQHAKEISASQARWEASALNGAGTPAKLQPWYAAGPFAANSFDAAFDTPSEPEKKVDLATAYQEGRLKWVEHPEWTDGAAHALPLAGENSATYLYRVIHVDHSTPLSVSLGSDDAIKVWLDSKLILADKAMRAVAPDQEKVTLQLSPGDHHLLLKIVNAAGIAGFYFNVIAQGTPADILAILKTEPGARPAPDSAKIHDYFLANDPPIVLKDRLKDVSDLEKQRDDFQASLPRVMIMSDAQPRKTHIFERGNYLSLGPLVHRNTPACLPPMPAGYPKNRLGLARWIMSPDNPLTARVQVNRYWQLFFGNGLVKTSENLGVQCDPPTYPKLLDWLAVEFRESGWNVKDIQRLIVTSATYRQSSKVSPALWRRDPENRLLARGARFRLPSPILRDLALAASGLLDPRIGGKPVYPYQPKGIWDGLAITHERDFTYPQSTGRDLYRRSIYTFWRRTVAPADMFDTSTRTTCKVRLPITSSPMYALTTLNDVTWVEAGRVLAAHVMEEAGPDPNARLSEAFRRICARRPDPDELHILCRGLNRALADFRADPSAAAAYLKEGATPPDKTLDPVQQAAYAAVCLAIFNLDEALTRE